MAAGAESGDGPLSGRLCIAWLLCEILCLRRSGSKVFRARPVRFVPGRRECRRCIEGLRCNSSCIVILSKSYEINYIAVTSQQEKAAFGSLFLLGNAPELEEGKLLPLKGRPKDVPCAEMSASADRGVIRRPNIIRKDLT